MMGKASVISLPNLSKKAPPVPLKTRPYWQSEPNPHNEIDMALHDFGDSDHSNSSPVSSVTDLSRRVSDHAAGSLRPNKRKDATAQKPPSTSELYNDPNMKLRQVTQPKQKKTKRQFVLEDAFNVEKTYTESLNVLVEVSCSTRGIGEKGNFCQVPFLMSSVFAKVTQNRNLHQQFSDFTFSEIQKASSKI